MSEPRLVAPRFRRVLLTATALLVLAGCSNPNRSADLPSLDSGSATSASGIRGGVYTDPTGRFRMRVNSAWEQDPNRGMLWWTVEPRRTGWSPTLTLIALPTKGLTGTDDQVMDEFEYALEGFFDGVDVVKREVLTSDSGNPLYAITFMSNARTGPIKVRTVLSVGSLYAAAATLSTEPSDFDRVAASVLPYQRSLDAG